MEEQTLWDILLDAGLTEDQIEQVMQMAALEGQGGLAKTQYEQAQQLRRSPLPEGRWSGRVYRKAHPLEFVSSGVDRIMGSIEADRQMKRQEDILRQQAATRAAFFKNLMNKQNPPAAPVAPGSMSPVPMGTGNPMTEALRRMDPYQLR